MELTDRRCAAELDKLDKLDWLDELDVQDDG